MLARDFLVVIASGSEAIQLMIVIKAQRCHCALF